MIKTNFSVPQNPDQVWSVLTDFPSFPRWNTYMRKASGELAVGKRLNIATFPESGEKKRTLKVLLTPMSARGASFSPTVTAVDKGRELRWRGSMNADWLFHGEHYWLLSRTPSGGTDVVHGEFFRGLLTVIIPTMDIFWVDFERMNRDMKTELARRYPTRQ